MIIYDIVKLNYISQVVQQELPWLKQLIENPQRCGRGSSLTLSKKLRRTSISFLGMLVFLVQRSYLL